jgi:ABC-2 type transport system ATP-binding protein
MTAALETREAGKRYGRRWALSECTLSVPRGRVAGLVGANGAGKTTLLHLAAGLLTPTAGSVQVFGAAPAASPAELARVGYVAQDPPVYGHLSVADHLRLGAKMNPGWDEGLARARVARLGLGPAQRAGTLSGGQRAQLALTLAIAKRAELLLLDEPAAGLDPLARRGFFRELVEVTAHRGVTVVLSSHLVADLERVCDYVIVLAASRVQVAAEVTTLLNSHHRLTGPPEGSRRVPPGQQIIEAKSTEHSLTLLARGEQPVAAPGWRAQPATLDDVILAYLARAGAATRCPREAAEAKR